MDTEVDTNVQHKQEKSSAFHMIQQGLITGVPIVLGYLPIAITFGVLAKQAGMALWELTMMSVLVFAGASQFMGANMIAVGAGTIEIIIATFVLNFRHFVMNLSFMNQLRPVPMRWKVPLSLGLTDETFAVSSMHSDKIKKKKSAYFYASLFLVSYLSWVLGSLLGGILGDIIPETLSQSMGIALYAMFIGLLIPSVKKEKKVGLIAIFAMFINALCIQLGMSTGWGIVTATVIGGMSGIFLLKEDNR